MSDWKLPWTARCRCERVRMTISAPPLITMACHCTGCQRMTASAYSLSVAVPAEGFPWAVTGAKHSFPDIPAAEAFGPLVAEYAQHGARPR